MIEVEFTNSTKKDKRLMATFYDNNKKIKTTHFGLKNYKNGTYIDHNDDEIKKNWIKRHSIRGTFENPFSASSLSYYILWNQKNLHDSIKSYLNHFNFSLKNNI
jgi:hypothetical protein